jgi:type 1 glutamine amidotransferase
MERSIRALLATAIAAVVLVPLAPAVAGDPPGDRGKQGRDQSAGQGHGGDQGTKRGQGHLPNQARKPRFRALIFSRTAAFRHTECIPQGTVAIAQMALRKRFHVDATENPAAFTDQNLAQYDVVIFLCTTGDVLNASQQAAFERFIRAGGGYAGIHSASDTEYDWAWYGGLVGAYFRDHPGVAGVNAQFQVATMNVEDRRSAATRHLPRRWTREEEWYNFRTNPRNTVHVLLSVDESTYDPRGYSVPGGSPPMGDHPIAWCQPYDGGRSFYTALGHRGVYWTEPLLLRHVLGGIEMAAGAAKFNCGSEDD